MSASRLDVFAWAMLAVVAHGFLCGLAIPGGEQKVGFWLVPAAQSFLAFSQSAMDYFDESCF